MKVEPKATSAIAQPPSSTATQNAQSGRDRAIAMLTQSNTSVNQSQVAPEELSAVSPNIENPQNLNSEAPVETKEEKQVEAPKTASKEEDNLSSQYAQLARKEKALRQQAKDLKAKEDHYKAIEESNKAKETEYQSKYVSKDKFQADLFGTLSELGYSYDQITEAVLSQGNIDPSVKTLVGRLEAKIASMEENQTKSAKAQEEAQKQQYQQAVNQIRNEVKSLVMTDSNYETIKETKSVNEVVDLIERNFKENGQLLSVEEAAQLVENELVEELSGYAKRIKKLQQKLTPPKQEAPKQQTTQAKQSQASNTLTNGMGVSRQLSAKERAILAFKGELKK